MASKHEILGALRTQSTTVDGVLVLLHRIAAEEDKTERLAVMAELQADPEGLEMALLENTPQADPERQRAYQAKLTDEARATAAQAAAAEKTLQGELQAP